MGLLIDFRNWIYEQRRSDITPISTLNEEYDWGEDGFNEARRAADWILSNLSDVIQADDEES
jgi:hypothetical protein